MLDYSMRSVNDNKLAPTRTSLSQDRTYLIEFRPTVDEFSIQQIHIKNSDLNMKANNEFLIPKCDSGAILIVIEASGSSVFTSVNGKLECQVGLVYFINANTDIHFCVDSNNVSNSSNTVLLAYRAYCDIKE